MTNFFAKMSEGASPSGLVSSTPASSPKPSQGRNLASSLMDKDNIDTVSKLFLIEKNYKCHTSCKPLPPLFPSYLLERLLRWVERARESVFHFWLIFFCFDIIIDYS